MKTTKERSLEIFGTSFNCAQSVFVGCNSFLPIKEKDAFKVAAGFGGGMRRGEVCGAVTGAIMAIGMKHGQTKSFDINAKKITGNLVVELENKFEKKFGSILCKDLLGGNLEIPSEAEQIHSQNLINKLCPKFIEFAAETTEKLLTK